MKTVPALVPVEIPVDLVLNSKRISNWVMQSGTRIRASNAFVPRLIFACRKIMTIIVFGLVHSSASYGSQPDSNDSFLIYRSPTGIFAEAFFKTANIFSKVSIDNRMFNLPQVTCTHILDYYY